MKYLKKWLKPLVALSLLINCVPCHQISNESFVVYAQTEKTVIPGGQSIGVTIETDGVLVSEVGEVISESGNSISPAKDAGIKNGDLIQNINGKKISSVDDLNEVMSKADGSKISVSYVRGSLKLNTEIIPTFSKDSNKYCLGLWVKDAASGIGTLTFYDPENKSFAALGHGISNPDTGDLLITGSGHISKSEIVSVVPGQKGIPGELKGTFSEDKDVLGDIRLNNSYGIFGTSSFFCFSDLPTVPLGNYKDVHKGKAEIYSTVDGTETKSYEIEIVKVLANKKTSKGMVIKITDKELLKRTGGIVQGMSGSPIVQNGKLVGAVTHVFVNDPTRGYGIFIENMLAEAEKIK